MMLLTVCVCVLNLTELSTSPWIMERSMFRVNNVTFLLIIRQLRYVVGYSFKEEFINYLHITFTSLLIYLINDLTANTTIHRYSREHLDLCLSVLYICLLKFVLYVPYIAINVCVMSTLTCVWAHVCTKCIWQNICEYGCSVINSVIIQYRIYPHLSIQIPFSSTWPKV